MDKDNIKVSVILPVYNVEPFIGRCIKSLQAQTLRELEFIFVNDCSTDGSMALVEAWAAEDSRVSILQNDVNLGAGASRNRGIEEARGDYLSFVDPDDYIASDFYQLLYAAARANGGHDIAKGSRVRVEAEGTRLSLLIKLSTIESLRISQLGDSFMGLFHTSINQQSFAEN